MNKKKAAFFDRDGTLIVDTGYLNDVSLIQLIHQSIAIARLCQDYGYHIFVITNQSGVARGFFDETFVQKTHNIVDEKLQVHGVAVEKYYYCPHHPDGIIPAYSKKCACRKPQPGMLLRAAQEFNLDLSQSLVFGDSACDFQAGLTVGCRVFNIAELVQLPLADVAKVVFSGRIIRPHCFSRVKYQ